MARTARALAGRTGEPAVLMRDHLIDAADRLLAKSDVTSITARELARAAGVSDGVLYNHFADKNDLLVTALVRHFGRLVAELQADLPIPATATAEENLQRLAGSLLELHRAAFPLLGKLLAEPALLQRFVAEIHRAGEPFGGAVIRELVVDYIAAEQRVGRLANVDASAAADLLIAGVALLALPWGAAPRDDRLRKLVRTLLNGLGR